MEISKETNPQIVVDSSSGMGFNGPKERPLVFVSGNFNVLHAGHLRLLKFAKECGNQLVVGVNAANSPGAILPQESRLEAVRSVGWVDRAIPLDSENCLGFIRKYRPEVVVKGQEHAQYANPELELVAAYGGKIVFGSGENSPSLSESETLSLGLLSGLGTGVNIKDQGYLTRHNFTLQELVSLIMQFETLKVLVIGEAIVDEYITCAPQGMSQEDPTIVLTPQKTEKFIGGAAIVAGHVRGFGADVSFVSVTGRDANSEFIREQLCEQNISCHIFEDISRPTILKQRYRAGSKTMMRVNHLRSHIINQETTSQILRTIEGSIGDYDLVIFSDFNYGMLHNRIVGELSSLFKKASVPMVVDSQSSSQIGDISRYQGMQMITPTEREARLALKDAHSGLVVLSEELLKQTKSKNIILKLGSDGVLIHGRGESSDNLITDCLPAFNQSPVDIAGAGDSLLAGASLSLIAGGDIWKSAYIGSLAAALQVSALGNRPLQRSKLAELLCYNQPW